MNEKDMKGGSWLAQLVECETLDVGVMSSRPMLWVGIT